jgi:hypothetical protein
MTESPDSIFYAKAHSDAWDSALKKGHALHAVPMLLTGKLKAETSPITIAMEVETVLSSVAYTNPYARMEGAMIKLGELIKGKVEVAGAGERAEEREIQKIKDQFEETCFVLSRQTADKKPFGAFVVGVNEAGGWRYYVLANKVWTPILPG